MPGNVLLLIDAQYDFTHPDGALYVPGAEADMRRVADWIDAHGERLEMIFCSLDSHYLHAIYHPSWFADAEGAPPEPFTRITADDVRKGVWNPLTAPDDTLDYLDVLEEKGRYPHTIWPPHCLIGSRGQALDDAVFAALMRWSADGKAWYPIIKGTYPMAEHYGIFCAEVPYDDAPETQRNTSLINALSAYDGVFLAGEAQSHCVAATLDQALTYAPALAAKITVLTDGMSPVRGCEHLADPIYAEARRRGVAFKTLAEAVPA